MDRIVKVFVSGADQERLASSYRVIERYAGFLLIEISEAEQATLAKRYPVEDITDLYTIELAEQVIDTSQPRMDAAGKLRAHPAYKGEKRLSTGYHHHLVQFVGPIKEEWLAAITEAGGQLRAPMSGFAYVVRADDRALAKIAPLPYVRWVGHLPHRSRIAPKLLERAGRKPDDVAGELPRTRILPGAYSVEFFDGSNMRAALTAIRKLGFEVLEQDPKARLAVLRDPQPGRTSAKRLRDLSAVHGVRFIRERSFKRPSNDVAARFMGSATALSASGLGLSGDGEVIAVCDTGLDTANPQAIHPDFAGRILSISSYPITPDLSPFIHNPRGDDGAEDLDSGHGTHVAGSVLGNGSASVGLDGVDTPIRGLAHRARLVFQAIEQEMQWKDPRHTQLYGRYLLTGIPADISDLFTEAYDLGARIHSNSWGGGDPGAYDAQCEQLDRFVWEHKDFCVLFAVGNDGTDRDGDGEINPMSVTSPATAKNCISVGACENQRPVFNSDTYGGWWPSDFPAAPYRTAPMADNPEQVVAFSSRGPTVDGRVKPDVVAPGTFILSTRSTLLAPNNMAWAGFPSSRLYFHMGGTSMATPLTAGAVALIREYLRKQRRIRNPSAALLKAAVIHGATRLVDFGPAGALLDDEQGFGRVNLDGVLVPTTPAQTEFVEITPGLRTGEVHSVEIPVQSNQAILRITLAYSDYPGAALVNNLNLIVTAPNGQRLVGNQGAGDSLSMDARNNVEVVHVARPQPGAWRVDVVASNVPQGPQDFALVYSAHIGTLPPGATVRAESTPGLTIPDNSSRGVSDVINITESGQIASVMVGVEIIHTYIGDLRVALTAPDRTKIWLHDRSGASSDDLIKTYDVHNTPALADLSGHNLTGDWRLTVSDHARRDVGQLRRWNLEFGLAASRSVHQETTPFETIPDDDPNGIVSALRIADSGTVQDIRVSVDITHTWIGDLRLQLIAPSGAMAMLHDRSGSHLDNIIRSYSPTDTEALRTLLGTEINGTWQLRVSDHAGRDVGKLNRWSLDLTV